MSTRPSLLKSVIGLGLVFGTGYLVKLVKDSEKLEVLPNIILEKINFESVLFSVDTLIRNPSKSSFTIGFPFVRIFYKDKLIGSSTPRKKWVKIPSQSESEIQDLQIEFPLSQSIEIAGELITARTTGIKIPIKIEVNSYIKLGLISFPIKKTETIIL
jgi:hypothetical protein